MPKVVEQTGKIRGKRPPERLTTAAQALEAFGCMQEYSVRAQDAANRAESYTGGAYTHGVLWSKANAYDDLAGEWRAALRVYLIELAEKEKALSRDTGRTDKA